jgi:hypothetical protein
MVSLALAKKGKYWWNANHSSFPFPAQKNKIAFDNQEISNLMTKEAMTLLLEFVDS